MREAANRRSRRKGAGEDRQTENRVNLYDEVTARIASELEAGRLPWVQPWGSTGSAGPGLPRNALTARTYSGVNVLILCGADIEHGWPSQSWLNFRQAQEAGGGVAQGERGLTAVSADRFAPCAGVGKARWRGRRGKEE